MCLSVVGRNPATITSKSMSMLKSERKWALSGTPLQNKVTDLFSLFRFMACR